MSVISPLQAQRLKFKPALPRILEALTFLKAVPVVNEAENTSFEEIRHLFPYTNDQYPLTFAKGQSEASRALRVGVLFSGGQAPGGHNVIAGLFDALRVYGDGHLLGFCDGPGGFLRDHHLVITEELIAGYRNQGGFDLLGSDRTKIETSEQFAIAAYVVRSHQLDGLVIIGGDDSNTNAAFLAEYFCQHNISTRVIGVPKTIDGDLQNSFVEISFGFDTACRTYAEMIGNTAKDALSAKKYYHFIKLMGRSASHIALECTLQTHVNLTFIGEEVASKGQTLADLVQQVADLVCERAAKGKHYGVILLPEGLIEFIPEFKQLLGELNDLLAQPSTLLLDKLIQQLSTASATLLQELPVELQHQLIAERDPHGNVQVSKIESERLLIVLVERELSVRRQKEQYKGKFSAVPAFYGYEGRAGFPSNFDCQYCYALGQVAVLLIASEVTGYMSCVRHLTRPVAEWQVAGIPFTRLMHLETRRGQVKAVIRKALVNLNNLPYKTYLKQRDQWRLEDNYLCPGPIQFAGPVAVTDQAPYLSKRGSEVACDMLS